MQARVAGGDSSVAAAATPSEREAVAGAGAAPRRVLMTADAVGGVFSYAVELSAALAPHGVEIALVVMGPAPSEAQRTQLQALPNVRPFFAGFDLEWMPEPWHDVQ